MQITVIGGGYVGIIPAVCFCEFGFEVGVADISEEKTERLRNNSTDIFEPGLDAVIKKFQQSGQLKFSTDSSDFFNDSSVIVVAVQTIGEKGEDCDLSYLYDAINDICASLKNDRYVAIIIRTAVPVGTCTAISKNIKSLCPDLVQGEHYDVIAIPGFGTEGSALHDFMYPDRIVVGMEQDSKKARKVIDEIYKTIINADVPFIYTNFETAELVRYATTGFIVIKIAFLSELINLCERAGANVDEFIQSIALDSKIGGKSLGLSSGIGGATYPRFVRILERTASSFGVDLKVLRGALESNEARLLGVFNKIYEKILNTSAKSVCIFGLTYKPKTSDIKESPSVYVIKKLLEKNIKVYCYDPIFVQNLNAQFIPEYLKSNENFTLTNSPYEAASQRDILVVMTEWMEIRSLDYQKISETMNKKEPNKPILIDFKNMFSPSEMKDFEYIPQGMFPDPNKPTFP
ncbi:MAG: nucleotide sugar dehydrogenase [Holosporales bacterium]|jgi:UDPglucose 6-dehydrogenase|nr:nucleotide sugar dehydrogenase [Holosporales bacterium]